MWSPRAVWVSRCTAFAMSSCDLAMDERVSTPTQSVTLCISDLLCGA